MSTETNTTPARAACEAFWAAVGAGPDTQDPGAAWGWASSQNTTRAWEAAAKAAVAAGRDETRAAYKRVCEERDELRKALGALYRERAHLTAFLAACYPSVQCPDQDDDEYPLLYVTTPEGQLSWHVRTDDADELLGHVPHDEAAEWDGHTTEEKYRRLEALVRAKAEAGP